jgi:hypothetical protein
LGCLGVPGFGGVRSRRSGTGRGAGSGARADGLLCGDRIWEDVLGGFGQLRQASCGDWPGRFAAVRGCRKQAGEFGEMSQAGSRRRAGPARGLCRANFGGAWSGLAAVVGDFGVAPGGSAEWRRAGSDGMRRAISAMRRRVRGAVPGDVHVGRVVRFRPFARHGFAKPGRAVRETPRGSCGAALRQAPSRRLTLGR